MRDPDMEMAADAAERFPELFARFSPLPGRVLIVSTPAWRLKSFPFPAPPAPWALDERDEDPDPPPG